MKKLIILTMILTGCSDGLNASRILEADGVTEIEITGYQYFGCGKDDTVHTGFRGHKNTKKVAGVVCSGLFKGYTIRYF